jgi:glycerophosphoryl diester phosphodiesterase
MQTPLSHASPGTEWIGHRGAPREFTENTLPAFQRAIERGAEAIELDVHATADGVVVVHHDPKLSRSRSPGQPSLEISATRWAALREVPIGDGAAIPTLADVLDLAADRTRVYVEIKGKQIERLVVDVIRSSAADCAIHSFDHDTVARVSEIAPNIPRGILFEDHRIDVAGAMRYTSARDVWPAWRLIDRELVTQVHSAGGRVIAWTVNAQAEADRLTDIAVDGICTDDLRAFNLVTRSKRP